MITDKLERIVRYGQGVLGLRGDDVILTSFEKSGNTWVRFFFCNLISLREWGGRTVDFPTLDSTMPELGADNLLRSWPHKTVPRIVKTHKSYWPIFKNKRSVLLLRDPRDVMVSFYYYITSAKAPRFHGSFSQFIHHPEFGLEPWFKHYESWKDRCGYLMTYEKLRKDDVGEFTKLLEWLKLPVASDMIATAAERSGFKKIREIEKEFGLSKSDKMKEGFVFTRKGTSGNWKEVFSDEDMNYFLAQKRRYGLDLYEEV